MNYIQILGIILFLHSQTGTLAPATQQDNTQLQEAHVTIFVHGLVGLTSIHSFGHLFDIINDEIDGTRYEQAVTKARADVTHYFKQAKQDLGLQVISIDHLPGNGAGATADLYHHINSLVNPAQQAQQLFFTFGWSGLANRGAQKEAGIELYYALEKLTLSLNEQGIEPVFTVIGYSHGGNVVLNLGAAYSLYNQKHIFSVEHLVLLATPIICETDYLIQSTLFKKIYNIYSLADACQELDILSFKRFGSKRMFAPRKNFKLPKNLYQIQVCVTEVTAIDQPYIENTKQSCAQNISLIKDLKKTSLCFQDCSPGHFDMWGVGPIWTGKIRKISPLNPLPVVVFMPYILQAAHECPTLQPKEAASMIVDFRPALHEIIVQTKNNSVEGIGWRPAPCQHVIPMIGLEKIGELARSVLCYKPNEKTPAN